MQRYYDNIDGVETHELCRIADYYYSECELSRQSATLQGKLVN